MFWLRGWCLAYSLTNLPKLLTNFPSFFHNALNMTWTTPSFNCKYPSMCVQTSHWPYEYLILMLCSWQWVHMNPWCSSWHLCCHSAICWFPHGAKTTCASFIHVQLLPLTSWHCVHQRWHLHLSWHCHCQPNMSRFTSLILRYPRICCFQCGSNQRTKLLQLTPHWLIPPLSSGGIWKST